MRLYCRVHEERDIVHRVKRRKANWIGYILRRSCLLNTLLKDRQREGRKRREDEEEDGSSYWMTLRKRQDVGN